MKALFLFLLSSSLLVNDAVAWTPVASNDGTTLATALTGVGGFAISNPSYSGGENSAATFSDAPSALGFTQGLVITTGNATLASHPVTENATGS